MAASFAATFGHPAQSPWANVPFSDFPPYDAPRFPEALEASRGARPRIYVNWRRSTCGAMLALAGTAALGAMRGPLLWADDRSSWANCSQLSLPENQKRKGNTMVRSYIFMLMAGLVKTASRRCALFSGTDRRLAPSSTNGREGAVILADVRAPRNLDRLRAARTVPRAVDRFPGTIFIHWPGRTSRTAKGVVRRTFHVDMPVRKNTTPGIRRPGRRARPILNSTAYRETRFRRSRASCSWSLQCSPTRPSGEVSKRCFLASAILLPRPSPRV